MSAPQLTSINRRALIAAVAGLSVGSRARSITGQSATPVAFDWPTPVDPGGGIILRDWRLFPTPDVMRFIVEMQNTTDAVVRAPVLGVVLPDLPAETNYGWAVPFRPVIWPGESTFLLGVAPSAIETDNELDSAEWLLCDEDLQPPDAVLAWQTEFTTTTNLQYSTFLETVTTLTNTGNAPLDRFALQGIVRDSAGRVCGGTLSARPEALAPGATIDIPIGIQPEVAFLGNPFTLIDDLTDCTVDFSLQPYGDAVNPGCAPVMPWNR